MSNTDYGYEMRGGKFPALYWVYARHTRIGVVMHTEPEHKGVKRWRAKLDRDPLVVGHGRTRDAAVNDALD